MSPNKRKASAPMVNTIAVTTCIELAIPARKRLPMDRLCDDAKQQRCRRRPRVVVGLEGLRVNLNRVAGTEEVGQRLAARRALGDDFERDQRGGRENDTRDSPK